VFAQTSAIQPYSALQNYQIGRDLEDMNQMDGAIPYYNEAIRCCMDEISSDTATAESYVILTWTLARQGRYSEVIQWGERGLRANTDYRLIETMGEACFYLKDYERALNFMQRYVNAVPQGSTTATAYFFVGEIYHLNRRFLHADIAYTTAVKLNPNNSSWWYRLGLSREAAGERTQAIKAYEQALKLKPRDQQILEALDRARRG
jgi:tetratricopeptide (TPR) repeat protein